MGRIIRCATTHSDIDVLAIVQDDGTLEIAWARERDAPLYSTRPSEVVTAIIEPEDALKFLLEIVTHIGTQEFNKMLQSYELIQEAIKCTRTK